MRVIARIEFTFDENPDLSTDEAETIVTNYLANALENDSGILNEYGAFVSDPHVYADLTGETE